MIDLNTLTPLQRAMLGLWMLGFRWAPARYFAMGKLTVSYDAVMHEVAYIRIPGENAKTLHEEFGCFEFEISAWLCSNVPGFEGAEG